MNTEPLLHVKNLKTYFFTDAGTVKSVDDVSFTVAHGKTLGIVGESGCGKSITSLSIMRLVETPPGKIIGGEILFDGENLLEKTEEQMRHIRGKKIAMIFQEPMTSLNPVYTIGDQIVEALRIHEKMNRKEAHDRAVAMLKLVKIPMAESRFYEYPHQLSGGMRQRVMIAMALSCHPQLLICDEPTTALDVTIQAQILELINELKAQTGASVIMITHDLGVISEVADDILVMYAGKVVETGSTSEIFSKPLHPYTEGLLDCIPKIDSNPHDRLKTIGGMVPGFNAMPRGCSFSPRCKYARQICREQQPELEEAAGRKIRCFRYSEAWKEDPHGAE